MKFSILPAAVIALVGNWYEYTGHEYVVFRVQEELSEKWIRLWKWYLRTVVGMFGSIVIMLLIPLLGVLIYLAATIGYLVVSILKLVYLYRTAKAFKNR